MCLPPKRQRLRGAIGTVRTLRIVALALNPGVAFWAEDCIVVIVVVGLARTRGAELVLVRETLDGDTIDRDR